MASVRCSASIRSPERLEREAGAPFQIHRISLKPYPCCRLFHSTIDALRDVTEDFTTPEDAIAGITVGGPEIMVTQHMLRRPRSVMAAQYSLPYALGASIVCGPGRYEGYEEERLADPRILSLADRVDAVADDAMQAAFPAHFGSWVELASTRRQAPPALRYWIAAGPPRAPWRLMRSPTRSGGSWPQWTMRRRLPILSMRYGLSMNGAVSQASPRYFAHRRTPESHEASIGRADTAGRQTTNG